MPHNTKEGQQDVSEFDYLFDSAEAADNHGRKKSSNSKENLRSLLVVSLLESAKAISASHDQQYSSLLSSVGPSFLYASTSSKKKVSTTQGGSNISKGKSKFFLAIFMCLFFIGAALFSIPAPFFPTRALEKGMSQTTAGLVLGSMQLVQFIAAFTFAFTMFHFGLKFMLCYGIVWASACSLLFGIVDLGPNDISYTVLCFAIRLLQGIGVSAYYISSSTITAILFSENYGMVTGMLQTCYSLGCLVGPSIGGALYAAGGYITPFAVIGGILLIFAPLIAVVVPSSICSADSEVAQSHESPTRVIKQMLSPSMFALFYTMLAGTMTTVVTETTLGVRLAQFNVTDPLAVGAVYLATSGAYGVTAPIAGRIADKYDAGWLAMFVGTIMALVGYLIIGPSPIFESFIPAGLPQLIIGCFIAHCGISACLIPMTRELQRLASANGLDKDHPSTLSFISAFFDSCWGMGGFLGATLGGTLMENLGFPMATTIQAILLIPSILMQGFLMLKFGHWGNCLAKRKGYSEL